ncbi:PucR family transcriptional regulator [Mycetocola reblochoni]|uniref:Regulatory protein n=2 Tax=Mycetocola reblochoni TaxID=331618 RepID=A0A1R4JUQ8_9MICO|nr:PucR family transcriptional regulator [Mycetocola reblochoni]RLP71118.1 PucR family transcriptional regulator [Mycetocola reblochoni]SJN35777.1 regulatory protein [Mycetocola reblochoni REB411]
MDIRELLDDAELGLAVIAAAPDALERTVRSAYITDLPDPSRFLSAGDIVLTSGQWIHRDGGVESFIGALARQNVAALIVGTIDIGVVPSEVIALCRERGLTLLTIASGVSFRAVVDRVAHAEAGERDGAASANAELGRRMAEAVSRGGSVPELLRLFAAVTGTRGWVVDGVGTLIAHEGPAPAPALVARVWNTVGRAEQPRVVVRDVGEGQGGEPVLAVRIGTSARSGLVAYPLGDQAALPLLGSLALDTLVGALRVETELAARWRDARNEQVASLFEAIRGYEVSPGAISARMRLEGLDPQGQSTVAAARCDDEGFSPDAVVAILERAFTARGRKAIGCHVDGVVLVLVNGVERDDVPPLAEQILDEAHLALEGRQLVVGLSDTISGVSRLNPSVATALERLGSASGSEQVLVSSALHVQSHRELLRMLGDATREGYAHEVLAPLIEYDERHGAELLATLRAFLAGSGAWQETARSLHLHPNTLRYRMARIQELTHRDVGELPDRVDLFLAVACLDGV